MLRGRARKQQLPKPPFQKNTLVERDFNLDQLLSCTLPQFRSSSSGSLVPWNACGPQLPRGVSVIRQERFMLLRKVSLAKRSAEGRAEGTTCSDSETCQRFEARKAAEAVAEGWCGRGFASLGLKRNKKHSSHGARLVQCCTDLMFMLDSAVAGVLIGRCHVHLLKVAELQHTWMA